MLHRAVPSRRRMQSRLRLGFGGSLARSAAPAGKLQTAKRHRNRVRAAGRSRVRGGLGDPIAYRTGRGGVRYGFGGALCARVPAPLLPTPMPPFAPQPPTATALPPLWASFPPAASTGWSVQPETRLERQGTIVAVKYGSKGYICVIARRAAQTTQEGERHRARAMQSRCDPLHAIQGMPHGGWLVPSLHAGQSQLMTDRLRPRLSPTVLCSMPQVCPRC